MYTDLLLFVLVNGVQVLLQKIFPELRFRTRDVVYLALLEVSVLYPVRVDHIISLLLWLCISIKMIML
jgi:hypothetical protein